MNEMRKLIEAMKVIEKERDEYYYGDLLAYIPQEPQRQDSTLNQLQDLIQVAQKLGMHDAADYILLIVRKHNED